jgi:hypothetical protein
MGEEQVRTDVTKEEAARRQLETAIALFFCEEDEISICVLANSAAQILTDICKKKRIESFRDIFLARVAQPFKEYARKMLQEP